MAKTYKIAPRGISRVLVVDVDEQRLRLLREIVRSIGTSQITMVRSPAAAMRHLESFTTDLIVVSGRAERGFGSDLVRYIRSRRNPVFSRIPVIEVLVDPSKKRVMRAIQSGVDELITWPLNIAGFRQRKVKLEKRPRVWIDIDRYFGPCRRRVVDPNYTGPNRRDGQAPVLAA
ncbi:MAG: response regulator [Pseudomonadota bacterium]